MSSEIKGTGVKFKFTRTDGTVIESDEFIVPAGKDGTRIFTVQSGEVALSGNWTAYLTQDDYEQAKVGDLVIGKNGIIGNILNKYPTNTVAGLNGVDVKSTQCFTAFSGDVNIIGDWTVQLALDDYASVRIGDTVIGKNGVIGTVRYKYPDNIATGNGGVDIKGDNAIMGVKGNAETEYRTGNVNLTPENIGAVNKAGDTMTGALIISKSGEEISLAPPTVRKSTDSNDPAISFGKQYTSETDVKTQWMQGVFQDINNGYGITTILGQYRDNTTDDSGFYIGQSWDENPPKIFWKFRQRGETFFPSAIYENGQRVYSPNNPPPASGSFHLYEYTIGIEQPICMSVEGFPTIYFQIVSAQNLKVNTEHSADSLGLVGCIYPATGKFRTSITSSTWYNAVKVSISSNGFNVTDGGGNDWCGSDGPVLHSFFYEDSPYFSLFIKSKRQIV